jgi:cell division septation protein DedD
MVTFRAGRTRTALLALLSGLTLWGLTACSREQQDWRSAEGADTSEAWTRFLEQHPDGELAPQARIRIAQLAEQRDWQRADAAGTPDAYREFLVQHPRGTHSEEARIRIEAFSLGSAPRIARQTPDEAAKARAFAGVKAFRLATAPGGPADSASGAGATAGDDTTRNAAPRDARAVPAAAPASDAARPATSGSYGVQLGAFGSPASADREWQRLQGRFGAQLGGLSPHVVAAGSGSGQLYRLQVAAAGEAQARALCDSLKEQAQACVPVVTR